MAFLATPVLAAGEKPESDCRQRNALPKAGN
jgi:hypothetical protein